MSSCVVCNRFVNSPGSVYPRLGWHTDGLRDLFYGRLPGPMFRPLRAAGLSAMNAAPIAKNRLMREAMGLTGELPSAARARVA